MNNNRKTDTAELSKQKKILFNIILFSTPFLLLFIVELFLRVINYGDDYNLFIDFPEKDYTEYKFINPDIGKKYFQRLGHNKPCGDMFLKEKPENGFRIFILGSSTALGFPYYQNLMFSRILEERLQDSYPDKKIEVINTAITAINSFTLLDFLDDVLKEEPDAILVYAGHNEFYGALGVGSVEKKMNSRSLTFLHFKLLSSKLYQLLRNSMISFGSRLSHNDQNDSVKGTLMKRIADNREIIYKGDIYNTGIDYYRKNMDQLLKIAKQKNVPVFISEVCSNIKDLAPFCSTEKGRFPPALDIFNDATAFEKEGRYDEAKDSFYYAKDLDCIRFRASEEINEIIRMLALKYNAYLVPMKGDYFEEASPNRLIGNNLITEHVHPNIEGYFLMADAFFDGLTESGVLGEQLNPVFYKKSSYYKKNWGYTALDSLAGKHGVSLLMTNWPFQSLESSSDEYKRTYRPVSFTDSLAFAVVTNPSLTIDQAHQVLGDFYLKNGDHYKAFKEYYSNVKYDPFQLRDLHNAIHCLTLTNDYSMALELVNISLALKESFYAYYLKGEILILKGDYKGSLDALNKAASMDQGINAKLQVLSSLHKLYYFSGNKMQADQILVEIKKVNPGYQPDYPSERKKYVFYLPIQVEEQVNSAFNLYRSGNFDQALEGFIKSLEIRETSLANRCVGDILFMRNDSSAIVYYKKAYPDYKNNPDFLFNMGILYAKYGQAHNLNMIVKEIKKIDPDNDKIQLLEKELFKLNS